jgi:predicted RNA binding protein YcfA (HicA-like mRNA interferase family)
MKLPQISGLELIKKLKKFGFVITRQRGSHIRLEKNTPVETIKLTIPNHKNLKKGTLHNILKVAGISLDDLVTA